MNVAVIVARTVSGKLIAGEVSESIAALTPKMMAIRDAGRMGKDAVNRVAVVNSLGFPADVRDVTPAKV